MIKDQELFIIRGLPGSGKTTFAQRIVDNGFKQGVQVMHNETDHFHQFVSMREDGSPELLYEFNRKLVGAAHDYCYGCTIKGLVQGHSVVVSNGFTTKREINRYVNGVKRCGLYKVKIRIIRMINDFGSIHNVPNSVIRNKKKAFEDYPNEIIYRSKHNG